MGGYTQCYPLLTGRSCQSNLEQSCCSHTTSGCCQKRQPCDTKAPQADTCTGAGIDCFSSTLELPSVVQVREKVRSITGTPLAGTARAKVTHLNRSHGLGAALALQCSEWFLYSFMPPKKRSGTSRARDCPPKNGQLPHVPGTAPKKRSVTSRARDCPKKTASIS